MNKANNVRIILDDSTDIDEIKLNRFFKKYKLKKHDNLYGDDIIKNTLDGIRQVIIDNEFKRVHEDCKMSYIKIDIYVDDTYTVTGYFTTEEINDIGILNDRIKLK